MTASECQKNIGKVVEYDRKLYYLLGTERGGFFKTDKRRVYAVIGARGEKLTVHPSNVKIAKPGDKP